MVRYLIQRLIWSLFVLWGVTLLTFIISHLIPADPAKIAAGLNATPEVVANVRRDLGLDRPLQEQYVTFLGGLIRGDLGRSILSRRPVVDDLRDYFPATLELTIWTMVVIVAVGLPLGIIAALRRNSGVDVAINVFASLWVALPVFWLGIVLQFFLYLKLGWFPIGGRISDSSLAPDTLTGLYSIDALLRGNGPALLDVVHHLLLPVLVLALHNVAIVARMMRVSLLEVMHLDYVRTARAKGLSSQAVIGRHALRNAALPVLTVVGAQFRFLLGGALLVEAIFQWPGIGRYATDAILFVDFPAVMGVAVLAAIVTVVVNLAIDLCYVFFDPRIRHA
jgi:peptide/nickel transport system permease protein